MRNGLLKRALGAFGLSAISLFSAYGQYKAINVDAPFPMNSIKEFVYPQKDFPITEYGAAKGGVTDNTEAIAKAIDACNKAGGGRVVVPEGEWLTGPIHFRSNVNLYLTENAILRFTGNPSDYLPAVMTSWEGMECYNYSPLVYAFECENIAITGKGMLSPEMDTWKSWFARPEAHMEALKQLYTMASTDVPVEERQMAVGKNHLRPHLIQFNRCKNVLLDGFKIRESPFWTIHMYMCDGGIARNLDVKAHGHNNDGIDLEMTRNFLIEDCTFDQGDDAVVIKAGRNRDAWRLNMPTENIVIRHCNILEGHTLLGIGSEISGGIRNVYMHDCEVPQSVRRLFFVKTNHRRGAFVENIYMENIKTGHVQRVLEIDTDVLYQWKDLVPTYEERITRIDGIYLKNVLCNSADAVYELKGDAKLPIRNVFIEDVHVGKVNDFIKKISHAEHVQERNVTTGNSLVRNGIPWFDDRGNIVNAHGACIVEDGGRYYLFGEWKSDESNAFPGFSCYSSDDLVNWKFENVVLKVQPDGILGPDRVGERVKVMKCPKTGEYVMLMHADDMGYKDPYIGVATCKTIDGDYELQGPLLYQGKPVKRWDMGTFQDTDGKGYLLIHHGPIYRLSDDYRSVEAEVAYVEGAGESPAMFRKNGVYYMLYSNLTSWEKNDNFYFTAPKIEGPWMKQGLFCPAGKLTYNSQSTFVFPLKRGNDTIPMFMGDRWSYPHQASAATYVWMPMQVDGTKLSIPEYWQCWDIHTLQSVDILQGKEEIAFKDMMPSTGWRRKDGRWTSNTKGSVLSVAFKGTAVAVVGESDPHSGYAKVSILDTKKDTVYSSLVDFYSKYPEKAIRIITPEMPEADYTLLIEVTGIKPVWIDKTKAIYGSDNTFVTIDNIYRFR